MDKPTDTELRSTCSVYRFLVHLRTREIVSHVLRNRPCKDLPEPAEAKNDAGFLKMHRSRRENQSFAIH